MPRIAVSALCLAMGAFASLSASAQAGFRRIAIGHGTPVEPAIGSTRTAAIVAASWSATIRSSSSARCAPHSGSPIVKAWRARS